VDVTVGLKLH